MRDKYNNEGNCVRKELSPWPIYIQKRLDLWDQYMEEFKNEISSKCGQMIKVTLPDGRIIEAESWRTSPYDIAKQISQGLADSSVIAKVNGQLWDLDRPLETDSLLELIKFTSDEGKLVYWHSTAHILGEAMERIYGGCLCYGPPIDGGFYYDMHMPGTQVSQSDYEVVESVMREIVKQKQPFQRLELSKAQLLQLFDYNEFKQRIIKDKVQSDRTTVYRCGPLIDLCRGPHVRHTGKIKAFKVVKNSATYWLGNSEAESLQRIYGISFPDVKQLKEWQTLQEEIAKRDHRKIGRDQELYFFHELSPGSCFFQPRGAHIYNTLVQFIRSEYERRGFQEVVTPNVFNTKLWQTSGHWQHYKENMFVFDVERDSFALKPMNCPGHCLIFDHGVRSWRDLPLRLADFGVLHRNELSGALSGLTRVRRFQQDDAHIFCTRSQIFDEMKNALQFLSHVYETFGFEFELELSTRPEKFLGSVDDWNEAEQQLSDSLTDFGREWRLNPGDGAFYGPKIDIQVKDSLRRKHQCATIQLDFQLPERFNLSYVSESGDRVRPVIVHRAILGSVERMIAILAESYAGKWPFWLSPRQAIVLPVSGAQEHVTYMHEVCARLRASHFCCDTDSDTGTTLNKKIRTAQLAQYNFILVVGTRELETQTVNVRTRDNYVHGEKTVCELLRHFGSLNESRCADSEIAF